MKRLSEFKDEAGIVLVSKLMLPIGRITQNRAVAEVRLRAKAEDRKASVLEMASAMLAEGAGDVMEILALLNETDPAEYHCTAASVLADVMTMFTDPDMQALFGLQRQTPASSASAPENTEARETSDASSDTAARDTAEEQRKSSGEAT